MLSPNSYLEKALHRGGKIIIIMLGRESIMCLHSCGGFSTVLEQVGVTQTEAPYFSGL